MDFYVVEADLYTCRGQDALLSMGLTDANAGELLLPGTGTWKLDGTLEEAVTLGHLTDDEGNDYIDTCVLKIHIRRNWEVYFVKQIMTMLLVTAGGLLALLMHPGDMLGDRCAQLLVAVLIVITTLQTDLGLGNLSYLIWVDLFNLVQLIVLLVALTQTMIIHRLQHYQMTDIVVIFDRVFRCLIPLVLYPTIVVGMILLGLQHDSAGTGVIVVGLLTTLILGAVWIKKQHIDAISARRAAIKVAQQLQGQHDRKHDDVVKQLFYTYDLDQGGSIDKREMRRLLEELCKDRFKGREDSLRVGVSRGMREVQQYLGLDEELDLASFMDAYDSATAAINRFAELDTDGDGIVSSAETRKHVQGVPPQLVPAGDGLHHGALAPIKMPPLGPSVPALTLHTDATNGAASSVAAMPAHLPSAARPSQSVVANSQAVDVGGAKPARRSHRRVEHGGKVDRPRRESGDKASARQHGQAHTHQGSASFKTNDGAPPRGPSPVPPE